MTPVWSKLTISSEGIWAILMTFRMSLKKFLFCSSNSSGVTLAELLAFLFTKLIRFSIDFAQLSVKLIYPLLETNKLVFCSLSYLHPWTVATTTPTLAPSFHNSFCIIVPLHPVYLNVVKACHFSYVVVSRLRKLAPHLQHFASSLFLGTDS